MQIRQSPRRAYWYVAVKEVQYNDVDTTFLPVTTAQVAREAKMQVNAARANLAPELFFALSCPAGGLIGMGVMHETLRSYLSPSGTMTRARFEPHEAGEVDEAILLVFMHCCILLRSLHMVVGISHGDISPDNMMTMIAHADDEDVKEDPPIDKQYNDSLFSENVATVQFIDFGKSQTLSSGGETVDWIMLVDTFMKIYRQGYTRSTDSVYGEEEPDGVGSADDDTSEEAVIREQMNTIITETKTLPGVRRLWYLYRPFSKKTNKIASFIDLIDNLLDVNVVSDTTASF
jgi:hypothetical protein